MTAVRVNAPYQVVPEATVYGPGQTVDVPQEIAHKWIDAGWVSEATQPEKLDTKAAPPYGRADHLVMGKACLLGALPEGSNR